MVWPDGSLSQVSDTFDPETVPVKPVGCAGAAKAAWLKTNKARIDDRVNSRRAAVFDFVDSVDVNLANKRMIELENVSGCIGTGFWLISIFFMLPVSINFCSVLKLIFIYISLTCG